MSKIKTYQFWWYDNYEPIQDYEKGAIILVTVLSFPLWLPFYLLYIFLDVLGSNFKQEVIEEEKEEKYY